MRKEEYFTPTFGAFLFTGLVRKANNPG